MYIYKTAPVKKNNAKSLELSFIKNVTVCFDLEEDFCNFQKRLVRVNKPHQFKLLITYFSTLFRAPR